MRGALWAGAPGAEPRPRHSQTKKGGLHPAQSPSLRKKPRASMGSNAGQDWRAWDVGRIKRAMYRVGARALQGNPRNLLIRCRRRCLARGPQNARAPSRLILWPLACSASATALSGLIKPAVDLGVPLLEAKGRPEGRPLPSRLRTGRAPRRHCGELSWIGSHAIQSRAKGIISRHCGALTTLRLYQMTPRKNAVN